MLRLLAVVAILVGFGLASPVAKSADTQPPPVPAVEYFIVEDGASVGPLTLEQMHEVIGLGLVAESTLVWKSGGADWKAAERYAELADALAAAAAAAPATTTTGGDEDWCPTKREWEESHPAQANSWYDQNNKDSLSFHIRQTGCKPRGPFQ